MPSSPCSRRRCRRDPRGLRLNNPGNIRHGADWAGLAAEQPDKEFCSFVDVQHGIRAMAKILLTYERHFEERGKVCCVANIIARWAPPNENDTPAYALHVADRLGVGLVTPLDLHQPRTMEALCAAIGNHENGVEINPIAVRRGVALALGSAAA
jgi:hypothetical protein